VHLLLFLQGQSGGGGSLLTPFIPMFLILAVFYFLLIRPQQKKQRMQQSERELMLKALKAGDKVITTGGIYGTVVRVKEKDDTVEMRIAQAVSIEIQRSSIAGLQSADVKDVEAAK
jgi:preprotein translocase subunit YajC